MISELIVLKCGLTAEEIENKLFNELFNVLDCEDLGLIAEFMKNKFINHRQFSLIYLACRNYIEVYN
jgi:hypothetical protein